MKKNISYIQTKLEKKMYGTPRPIRQRRRTRYDRVYANETTIKPRTRLIRVYKKKVTTNNVNGRSSATCERL